MCAKKSNIWYNEIIDLYALKSRRLHIRAPKPPELPAAPMLATSLKSFLPSFPPTLLILDRLLHDRLVTISFSLIPPTNEVVGR